MTHLGLLLRSRVFFVLLYSLFLWSMAMALVSIFSMRLSVPNLVQGFAPALLIGAAALGYWLYVTQFRESGLAFPFERPPLSLKLLIPLLLAGFLGAAFVLLTGNRVPSVAGVMIWAFYILGLIGVVVLSALKPYLGICALFLTLPVALLLHLDLRFAGWSDNFSYIAMNPEILLVLVTFLSMMAGFLARSRRPVRTRLDIPIAIFLLGSLVSLAFSPNLLLSSRVLFVGTVVPVLCYYLIVNGLRTRRELVVTVYVLLGTFFLMGSYSLLAFQREVPTDVLITGEERLTQFFVNPGLFALMLTLILPLPLCLAAFAGIPFRVRIASSLVVVVLFVALIFTYIRGAWLGFAVSLVVLLLLSSEIRRLFLKLSPLLLAAFLIWSGTIMQIFWARTESIEALFQSLSWTDRLVAWQSAWQMIVHNPLAGVGPGLFGVYYPEYEVTPLAYFQVTGMNAHNLFLNVWSETGTVAMIGLVAVLAVSLWMGFRLLRSAEIPLLKAFSLGMCIGLMGWLTSTFAHGILLVHVPLNQLTYFGGHTFYLFIVLALTMAPAGILGAARVDRDASGNPRVA